MKCRIRTSALKGKQPFCVWVSVAFLGDIALDQEDLQHLQLDQTEQTGFNYTDTGVCDSTRCVRLI